jgi:type IV fimbrial biogenesis protein FimT
MQTTSLGRRGSGGYSVVELVVTLVIIGIVASLAAPKFDGWMRTERTRRALDNVAGDLMLTRLSAVRSGRTAVFQLAADGRSYSVVVNPGGNPQTTVKTVRLNLEYPGLVLVSSNGNPTFSSRGLLTPPNGAGLTARWGSQTARLTISPVGRVYREF